jgi:ankyrin repeat protein
VVRLLLEHKADPNLRDPITGNTPLNSVSGDAEVVRMLVEAGADIDALQPSGLPPVVGFISTRDWDSAIYLINKGARLDLKNADGLSVDYWLEQWKESVYGEHPEGWDRVRQAIAARR